MEKEKGVQGMRGLAASMVLSAHLAGIVGLSAFTLIFFSGDLGVVLFFVISGYILMRKFNAGDYSNSDGSLNTVKYYLRRIFRIWPLYFLILPIFAFLYHSPLVWQDFLFIQNYFPSTFLQSPLWTILIEELFYLIFPLWALSFKKNWKISIACMFTLSLVYIGLMAFVISPHSIIQYLFSQFPVYAISYALGTIIALGKEIKTKWQTITAVVLIGFGLSPLGYAALSTFTSGSIYLWFRPFIFSVIFFVFLSTMRQSKILAGKVAQFIGGLTYPFYLVGIPVQWILTDWFFGKSTIILSVWQDLYMIPLIIGVIIIVSYLLHVLIEQPFIALGRKIEKRIPRMV